MNQKKYELCKEPYLRKADYYGTNNIMIDFIISLLPVILIGWYQNGYKIFLNNKNYFSLFYPIIFIALGSIFTYISEVLFIYLSKPKEKIIYSFIKSFSSYSIIPGMLLAIILPLKTPIWVLLIGCIFASIFGKMIYGGFGKNIFNPALLGYIFVMTAFYGVIEQSSSDIVSSSTPLMQLNNVLFNNLSIDEVIKNGGGIFKICFGLKTGTIGETSSIACFISLIYLSIKKVIDLKTPLIILITFLVLNLLIGVFIKSNPILFSLFNLFNGGIIFGATFMATEPVTSPRSYYGKIIYAFLIGLIATILRLISDLRDGTSTSILFMNMLSIILDNYGAKLRLSSLLPKIKGISIFSLIALLLTTYTILKINNYKVPINDNQIEINILSINQDYELLKDNIISFIYEININNSNYNISSDIDGNITSNLSIFSEEEQNLIKEEIIKNKINKRSTNNNKHYGYIVSVEVENDAYIITSYARGYFDNVRLVIKFKNNTLVTEEVDLSKEIELSGGLANSNGSKKDLIAIGEGNRSDIVSNVTYTSVSLISARNAILDYINNYLGDKNE